MSAETSRDDDVAWTVPPESVVTQVISLLTSVDAESDARILRAASCVVSEDA